MYNVQKENFYNSYHAYALTVTVQAPAIFFFFSFY